MSKVHDLINHERKKRGIPHVYWSREMARLAQSQANYCAKVGHLVHSNKSSLQGGENLAEGGNRFSPRAIVRCWLDSKAGHRENLLSPMVKKAGVGIAKAGGKTFVAWASSYAPPSYPDCPHYRRHMPFWRRTVNKQIVWLKKVPLLLVFAVLILVGAVRIATWVGWLSLPWIEGGGSWYFYWKYLSVEFFLIIFGLLGIMWAFTEIGMWRSMLSLCVIVAVAYLSLYLAIPEFNDILFWRGPDGEKMEEFVHTDSGWADLATLIAGADGNPIWLHNNPEAIDPSWVELKQFLQNDQTNKLLYNGSTFVCGDFAERLHNNAEKAGIRAAFVSVSLGSITHPLGGCSRVLMVAGANGHACNAFQTTDRGLVFIDDTGMQDGSGEDCTVSMVKGQNYTPESIFSDTEWCPTGSLGEFRVFW